jgi:RPA family protein
MTTITDDDLMELPVITDVGEICNRAVVIGGYQQNEDKSGNTKTTTTTITNAVAKNQSFVPTEDYLSSVLIYTELVTDSDSNITISIQGDSAAAPDDVNLPNGQKTTTLNSIVNAGYTEFRFANHVTLTPGDTYWIVLKGTTADGVKVGVDGGAVLDYVTRYPVRVAIMTNDNASQIKYGSVAVPMIYMQTYRDQKIEDSQYAEQIANNLLQPDPKKVARVTVQGDSIKAGDIVQLTISKTGIAIDKIMKIMSSTQTLGEIFIYNELEMQEV